MHYTVSLIKDRSRRTNVAAAANVREQLLAALRAAGTEIYGVFVPLFGLASNECYLVTFAPTAHDIDAAIEASGFDLLQVTALVPTVRPVEHSARSAPGIYVFRWFKVESRDVAEIVRLSNEAWVTFEGGFETEVQALFAEEEQKGTGTMLLITWYKDLSVWEASRQPSAAARENFQRRSELTLEATPICTRLAPLA